MIFGRHKAAAVIGMHRPRYRGLAKTHLEHVFSATALNLLRLHAWWTGNAPEPPTSPASNYASRLDPLRWIATRAEQAWELF